MSFRDPFNPFYTPLPHPLVALLGFYVGAEDSGWGPHACLTALMPTEPPPSLKSLNLKKKKKKPMAEVGVSSQLEVPRLLLWQAD